MFGILFKIWYFVAIFPFLIFLEADKKFAAYLKKKEIYMHWDIWHSLVVVLVILLIVLLLAGTR